MAPPKAVPRRRATGAPHGTTHVVDVFSLGLLSTIIPQHQFYCEQEDAARAAGAGNQKYNNSSAIFALKLMTLPARGRLPSRLTVDVQSFASFLGQWVDMLHSRWQRIEFGERVSARAPRRRQAAPPCIPAAGRPNVSKR